jgi:hypothetical protein
MARAKKIWGYTVRYRSINGDWISEVTMQGSRNGITAELERIYGPVEILDWRPL